MINIYFGEGKGKTSAAIGLAIRAAGSGTKCAFLQFMKGRPTSESVIFDKLKPLVIFEQYGLEEFYRQGKSNYLEHRRMAVEGIKRAENILIEGEYGVVVLDEILTALEYTLITYDEILGLIPKKNSGIEMVFTGRKTPEDLIDRSDLVSKIKEVKHPYRKGVNARKGIEY